MAIEVDTFRPSYESGWIYVHQASMSSGRYVLGDTHMAYIYKDTEHLRVRPHDSMISYDIHDLSISYSVHTSRIERKKSVLSYK